jgi:hypothetical protein
MADSFTPAAEKKWQRLSAAQQSDLLNNVWCPSCSAETTITGFTGRLDRGDLILEGQCAHCAAPVARLIESQ